MKALFKMFSIALVAMVVALSGPVPEYQGQPARAAGVRFDLTDEPGRWFKSTAGPIAGTHSLAVVAPGARVDFGGRSNTKHTITTLIVPAGARPFDSGRTSGSETVQLAVPGLYVFFCQIHPYMFAGVIVDDPDTAGLDLGESITLINGVSIPTSSDLATRLLRTFFIATNPANWKDHGAGAAWHITYPDVDVRITGGAVVNLPAVLNQRYGNDTPKEPLFAPVTPGVGEVLVDTQFELTRGKTKPGTVTAVDTATWTVTRKVALPSINMNNPHNMWTDREQKLVYVTEWFDSKLTVFNRETGALVRRISVGDAPAHVMTRPDTDQVYVTLNGSDSTKSVVELSPGAASKSDQLDIGAPHPHAHWISADGQKMVTPNVVDDNSSIFDFNKDRVAAIAPTGSHPLATGMMPDGSKYYVANLADSSLTVIETKSGAVLKTIDLLANYSPVSGEVRGPVGGLPIQTPVSPDGRFVVTAATLTGTIVVVDTKTDSIVAMLPGGPGTHGVQFGARRGGGYYAYVTNKFSNDLLVVDPDPNGDGTGTDARVAGRVLLAASAGTVSDDQVTGNPGMGGQGVLPVPIVYNGWVQHLPKAWADQLTPQQRNPLP